MTELTPDWWKATGALVKRCPFHARPIKADYDLLPRRAGPWDPSSSTHPHPEELDQSPATWLKAFTFHCMNMDTFS